MDIVLALLRTLVFVVATVAATVYIGRRIGRGRPLLWAGTTLLALHWLIGFGWTTYQAGSPANAEASAGWVTWTGYLLPFLAALAYIWGIGQAAGFPARTPEPAKVAAQAGAAVGAQGGESTAEPATTQPAQPAAPPSTAGMRGSGGAVAAPPTTSTPAQPAGRSRQRPPGLGVPHAVPVVMTPSSKSHQSPPDPDPVVDLGPEPDQPAATDPLGTAQPSEDSPKGSGQN